MEQHDKDEYSEGAPNSIGAGFVGENISCLLGWVRDMHLPAYIEPNADFTTISVYSVSCAVLIIPSIRDFAAEFGTASRSPRA